MARRRAQRSIRVGVATVLPGDAGDEALRFFPSEILDEVVSKARARQELEDYERALLRTKTYRLRDVYPLHPKLRKAHESTEKEP